MITSSNRAWSLSRGNERWIDFAKRDFPRQNPIDLEFSLFHEKTVSGKVDERTGTALQRVNWFVCGCNGAALTVVGSWYKRCALTSKLKWIRQLVIART